MDVSTDLLCIDLWTVCMLWAKDFQASTKQNFVNHAVGFKSHLLGADHKQWFIKSKLQLSNFKSYHRIREIHVCLH